MEENVLGYICRELGNHSRRATRFEQQLSKQRNFNFLVSILLFGLVIKISSIDKQIKALKPEGEKV